MTRKVKNNFKKNNFYDKINFEKIRGGAMGNTCEVVSVNIETKTPEEIIESLRGPFRKSIWTKFLNAVNEYKLVEFPTE